MIPEGYRAPPTDAVRAAQESRYGKTGCRWGYLSGYDGYVFHIYVIWIHMVKVIVLNIVIYVLPSGNLTELWQITMLHR